MTHKQLANSPAFPSNPHPDLVYTGCAKEGMTLRQHYAGLAMQGLLASLGAEESTSWIPERSVELADELLARLSK